MLWPRDVNLFCVAITEVHKQDINSQVYDLRVEQWTALRLFCWRKSANVKCLGRRQAEQMPEER